MSMLENMLTTAAATSEMSESDLLFVFSKGERKTYAPDEYLFHEGSPCLWAGIIEDGIVEIVRKKHGSESLISVLSKGSTIAEAAMIGDTSHDVSVFTRTGVTVWQVPREVWQATQQSCPDIYYRMVGRVATKLRYAADQLTLAREVLRKNYDQVLREGWLSKDALDYIMKQES